MEPCSAASRPGERLCCRQGPSLMWSAGEGASTQMASLSSSAPGCCSSSSASPSLQVGHYHVPVLHLCITDTPMEQKKLPGSDAVGRLCELVRSASLLHLVTALPVSTLSACPCKVSPTAEGRQSVCPSLRCERNLCRGGAVHCWIGGLCQAHCGRAGPPLWGRFPPQAVPACHAHLLCLSLPQGTGLSAFPKLKLQSIVCSSMG